MLYVGYYTEKTPYEAEAKKLTASLDKFDLEYEIVAVKSRGSWQKNTQMKAEVIRDFIFRFPNRPFVYLDVDAVVEKPPVLFDSLRSRVPVCDIAAHKFKAVELASGTVYFGGTAKTTAVVDKWVELCKQYPDYFPGHLLPHFRHKPQDFAWDQRMLDVAIRQTPDVQLEILPPEYCWIFDLCKEWYPNAKEPVIVHNAASRRYRKVVNI